MTPVIYLYLEVFQEKVLDRTTFFRSAARRAAGADASDVRRARPAPSPVAGGSESGDDGTNV